MIQVGNKVRRLIAGFLAMLLLVSLAGTCLAAEEDTENSKVIRVIYPQAEGYTMTAADGSRYGIVVDFLDEIAKYTGWKYEYVDVQNEKVLSRFGDGSFDLMGGQFYMDGLEEFYGYPEYNCGYSKLVLLARRDDGDIKSFDLNSFNGKTIGVYERAKENIRRLQIYLELNDLDCTLKYYSYEDLHATDTGDLTPYLENGDVDLLMGSSFSAGDVLYIAASFDSQPHYIVTEPGNQKLLDELNEALEKIYEADPNFAQKVYDANFPETGNSFITLKQEELDYVSQKKTATVAIPRNWHPLMCLENDDSHNGLVPDILSKIEEYSGLKFQYLYCESYEEALSMVQNGGADLLGFYLGNEEEASENGLALTPTFAELSSILVRNKESTYPSEGLTGAVMNGRILPESIVAAEVKTYSDISDALADVNSGKVDFCYGISSRIESMIQQNNYVNLVQVNLVNENVEACFAMPSPVQPELFSILSKGINSLSDEEKTAIRSRNLVSIGESHITLSSIVYGNPGLAISAVSLFLILLLVVVIIVSRSRIRAASMRLELQRAEADNRAKSQFLSRMSHEIRTPMNAIIGLTDLTGMTEDLPEQTQRNLSKIKSSSQYLLSLINDILDMSRIESGKMEIASEPFSMNQLLEEIRNMLDPEAVSKKLDFRLEKEIRDDVLMGDAIRLRQVLLNLLSNAFKFTAAGGTVLVQVVEQEATEEAATFAFRVKDTGIGIAKEDQKRVFASFEQLGTNVSKSQGTGLGLAISSSIVQQMGGTLQLESELDQGSEFYFTITLSKGRLEDLPVSQPEEDMPLLGGVKILVAEDNDLNAEIVIELLHAQGAEVVRAENGKIALEMFEHSRIGEFQAILMDILMPEMDGLEATAAIRSLTRRDAGTIPIIAMTANAFKEDEQSAMAAGMTGFLSKPVNVSLLYGTLAELVKN